MGAKHPQQEFIQIDTKDILFICGGAFEGIEKIIERRTDKSSIGFGSTIKDSKQKDQLVQQVIPQDLVRFGLIPELVGARRCSPCWNRSTGRRSSKS